VRTARGRRELELEANRRASIGDNDRITVPAASSMTLQTLRLHIQKRHLPRLGFWDRRAHDEDHRRRKTQLDHIHEEDA
jgi:hypothetical protein